MMNEILIFEGKKAREEVEKENWMRKIDGLVAKRRGWLKKEAADDIESQLEDYRQRLLEIPVQARRPSNEKVAARRVKQQEHQERRRKEKNRQRRESEKAWAKIGKASVKLERTNLLKEVYDQCMVADGIDWNFAEK